MPCETFLAIDWGPTNRRVYLIESGQVASTADDGRGAASGCDFAAAVAAVPAIFDDLPMLFAAPCWPENLLRRTVAGDVAPRDL